MIWQEPAPTLEGCQLEGGMAEGALTPFGPIVNEASLRGGAVNSRDSNNNRNNNRSNRSNNLDVGSLISMASIAMPDQVPMIDDEDDAFSLVRRFDSRVVTFCCRFALRLFTVVGVCPAVSAALECANMYW